MEVYTMRGKDKIEERLNMLKEAKGNSSRTSASPEFHSKGDVETELENRIEELEWVLEQTTFTSEPKLP
jgi:hypothetical protein